MAVLETANFNGSNGSHFYIELQYVLSSQDAAEVESTVTYYLYAGASGGYSGSGAALNGYINGTLVGSTTSIGKNGRVLLGTLTETIPHEEDGTCSPSYSASASAPWTGLGSASLSGVYSLPPIAVKNNSLYLKVDDVWKKGSLYIKIDGVWKKGTPYLKANGTWEKSSS